MIKRYNKNRTPKEQIAVRYVFGLKERVMYDIINRAQNLTLPVVVIDASAIRRDPQRVQNKHDNLYINDSAFRTPGDTLQLRTPVPVQISINLTILAGYQLDLEQIASNFIAYFNPYIILSTKIPSELGPEYDIEVRTKAQWDGNLTIETPNERAYTDKFKRVGSTTFVLDAWIYPEKQEATKPVYFIDANFHAVNQSTLNTASYYQLSSYNMLLSSYPDSVQHVETVSLSGTPTITNLFFSTSGKNLPLDSNVFIRGTDSRRVLVYGYNFNDVDYVLLSAADTSQYKPLTSIQSTYYGTVSGAIIDNYDVLNDNMIEVEVPYHTDVGGEFSIILYNKAGWSTTKYASSNTLTWSGSYYTYALFEDGTIILTEDGQVIVYELAT